MPDVVISDQLRELVSVACLEILVQLGNPASDLSINVNSILDQKQRIYLLGEMERLLGLDLRKLHILEIGSGVGLFTVLCRSLGLSIVGSEPAANAYGVTGRARRQLLADNALPPETIAEAPGEVLPFDANNFDLIVSFNVIEHVRDPRQVLAESYRVLKPGGLIYFKCPSYSTFYEGHYGIFWLPWLNKETGKRYVRLWGRNPAFLDELFFIRPELLKRWATAAGFEFLSIFASRNQGAQLTNPIAPEIVESQSNTARSPIIFRLLWSIVRSGIVATILQSLHIYPMITLIARKPYSVNR